MSGTFLERCLMVVGHRLRRLRVLRRQAICWIMLMVPAMAVVLAMPVTAEPSVLSPEFIVLVGTTLLGLIIVRSTTNVPTRLETAQLLEQCCPELDDAVVTAVRVDEDFHTRQSVMSGMVIEKADHLARQSNWRKAIPGRKLFGWSLLSLLSFCCLVSSVLAAGRWGRDVPVNLSDQVQDQQQPAITVGASELVVEPGDIEIERGTALTVVARFSKSLPAAVGLEFIPDESNVSADQTIETESPEPSQPMIQMMMDQTVDEGVFAARLGSVTADGSYRVIFVDEPADPLNTSTPRRHVSPSYKVTTYVRPRMEQLDAQVTPPEYTGRGTKMIEDTLRLVVVEGSVIRFLAHLNKPVAVAQLISKDGSVIELTPDALDPQLFVADIVAQNNETFGLHLEDLDGRTAAEEEQVLLRVTRNKPAKIKVTFPGKDTNVSPLQEFHVEAEASDDFAVLDYGIVYSLSGADPETVSLVPESNNSTTASKVTMKHMIALEDLGAEPDDLLTYYFYADTHDSSSRVQRTYSDMMFAEVRRFEEIFRESQQQNQQQQQQQQQNQQQQQQNQNQTDQLIQLQREIILATWNVLRSLEDGSATAGVIEDINVIAESQAAVIEQLAEVKEQAANDLSLSQIVQSVEQNMQKAAATLAEAASAGEASRDRLNSALFAEQSAYQGLLKLRAREHEVQQQQGQGQGQGQGQQNSASQQQLQQLELSNDRNRYESERQAQQQQEQSEQQREQLQVLNRLKELARRQEMLNERLKQLQSELRTAETEEEKDEIERELKRLREEQREMLRDVDELRERMDQAPDQQQQQNRDVREQVEQARSNVQQASRAMDTGQLSEAISEGTRAERQFEQLQEEFRNRTSSAFEETMRDLRQQARDLSQRQEEIAREIAGESGEDSSSERPSLRSNRNRDGLQEKVAEQRDQLNRVLEQTKDVIQQAEESEPLLSRRLYDTVREMRDMKPEEALEATEFLVGRGLWNQSGEAEQVARRGIDQLREGIEDATDSVLGSEAEALRRASNELEDLSDQLSEEVRSATGQDEPRDGQPGDGNSAGQNPEGQQPGEQRQPGTGQQGESGQQQSESEEQSQRPGNSAQQRQPSDQESQQQGQQPGQGQQGQSGQEPGRQPGQGQQQSQQQNQQPGQQGQSPGNGQGQENQQQQNSQQQGQQSGQGGQPGQQPGQGGQQGQAQNRQQQSQQGQDGQPQDGNPSDQPGQQQPGQQQNRGGGRSGLMGGGRVNSVGGSGGDDRRPLTGEDFSEWSDRLRDVEEMLEDPELRNRVAQVRDRARSIRAEFRRHGTEPQWDLVKSQLLDEMQELQRRVNQELSRLESDRSMAPIDREPVPEEFDELVQRYYELLGQQREEDSQ